jgi:serine/threonine protein kinase
MAVGHCHICEIVHRNINPKNIMLGPRNTNFEQLKVVGFGSAVHHHNPD